MFVEHLGQIQEEIGKPGTKVEEKRNSMEEMEEERTADTTHTYEERAERERVTQTITIPASVWQLMKSAIEKLTREQ